MQLTMDKAGRLVVPKPMRDALGLSDGGVVEISLYGHGLQIVASGPTARLVETPDGPVFRSETVVTDEMMYRLIDSGRR